jgi:hypothetical protein
MRRIFERGPEIVNSFDAVTELNRNGNNGEDAGSRAETIHALLNSMLIVKWDRVKRGMSIKRLLRF